MAKKNKNNTVSIPIKVEGENIYLGNKRYTFLSLTIMAFIAIFSSLAAVVVSIINIIQNGNKGYGILFLIASLMLMMWGILYHQALLKARKLAGRKSYIQSIIDKIWN